MTSETVVGIMRRMKSQDAFGDGYLNERDNPTADQSLFALYEWENQLGVNGDSEDFYKKWFNWERKEVIRLFEEHI